MWGLTQPFAGRLADHHGAGWVVFGGAVLYVTGLYMMSLSQSELGLLISAGIAIGGGLRCRATRTFVRIQAAALKQRVTAQHVFVLGEQGCAHERCHFAPQTPGDDLVGCTCAKAGADEDIGIDNDAHASILQCVPELGSVKLCCG